MNESRTSIPLSQYKLFAITLGSFVLVGICIWIWFFRENHGLFDLVLSKLFSIIGIVFFGFGGIYGCIKLFDMTPGLVIDHKGIIDNSSGVSAGRIHWEEIIAIRMSIISGQRFVTIDVTKPEKYQNCNGIIKTFFNNANMRLTGSPINISANTLKIGFDELLLNLTESFDSHTHNKDTV